ncbi:MAG: hypothetical protein WBN13_01255 [Robiginitalea sp.]|uniref:hypothetical protein n=1 Tax=Robiginitalea sp. TaxID=1902411 RepID=UPI003C71B875
MKKAFSELTDLDWKFARTLIDLFRAPSKVLSANSGQYTSALKYASIVIGAAFFLILFFGEIFNETPMHILKWRTPLRLQQYRETQENVEESFGAVILALSMLPGVFVLLRILFAKQGSWKTQLNTALYFIAQFAIILSVFGFLTNFVVPVLEEYYVLEGMLFGYTGFFFLRGLGGKWYFTLPKSAIILFIGLLSYGLLSPFLTSFLTILFYTTETYHSPDLSDRKVIQSATELPEEIDGLYSIEPTEDRYFYIDENGNIGAIGPQDSLLWIQKYEDIHAQHLLVIPEHELLLVAGDSEQGETIREVLLLYSSEGRLLLDYFFDKPLESSLFQLIRSDSDGFEILIPTKTAELKERYDYDKIVFHKSDGTWNLSIQKYITTPFPLGEITKLSDSGYVSTTLMKSEWHWYNFGIAKFDKDWNVQWHKIIYDKKDPYDPRRRPLFAVDESDDEILIQYAIANDTNVTNHLRSIDLFSGSTHWRNAHTLPADYTEYWDMALDKENIYLVGESHYDIRRFFWKPSFHAGMISGYSRSDGSLKGQKRFGIEKADAHSRISYIEIDGGNLRLLGTESDRISLFNVRQINFSWSLNKGDL